MKECFCGCGRRVGLTYRAIDKQGRRTVDLLTKLEAARNKVETEPVSASSDTGPMLRHLDQLIESGESFRQGWAALAHDEAEPFHNARQLKREWLAWGKKAMPFEASIRAVYMLPPADRLEAIRQGLLGND